MLRFHKTYFNRFLPLLIILVAIAVFFESGFIRHTAGDFLVVIMLFYLIMSFIRLKPLIAAWIVLIMATAIELMQYFKINEKLGLEDHAVLRIIFGTTFQISDLVAYTMGIVTVLILEKTFFKTEG